MENKEVKEVYIDNLIALCHILDGYDEFNKNLRNLMADADNILNIDYLYRISKDKFIHSAKNVNQFYKKNKIYCISKDKFINDAKNVNQFYEKNKIVVDTINKYIDIWDFINFNYDIKGNLNNNSSLNFFYQYILNNREDLDKILLVLNKIKELGFNCLKFDENLDFTTHEYNVYTVFDNNIRVEYLDNMERIPNYQSDVVKYKTTGSNYKISIIPLIMGGNEKIPKYDTEIIINSLTFNENRLPETILKENTFDKIISLAKDKREECSAIRNSIDLSMGLDSLSSSLDFTNNLLSKIDDIENKDELLKVLSEMKLNLDKLKKASISYDNSLFDKYSISKETFQKEKRLYLDRQYWPNIDID